MGPLLGNKSPGRRDSIAGVVFTPTRGVIHPSFPLRGRWERTPISGEQAPSPSLVTRLDSSSESHPTRRTNARGAPRGKTSAKTLTICKYRDYGRGLFRSALQFGFMDSIWN